MSKWKEYKLGDICSRLSSGKGIKSSMLSDSAENLVYGGNGIRGYTSDYNFEGDCAIIGRQGAYCGNVRYFCGKAYMTEHAIIACANDDNNTRYLSYVLSSMNLGRLSGQSAQPGISVKTLSVQKVKMPPLDIQRKIVAVISALEEKIELNTQINENLEQQAQAIFKAWFVDFEPFGGIMPDDWFIDNVSNLAKEIICGKTPSTKKKEYYGNYMPFITIPDMHNCVYAISTERYLSELGAKSQENKTIHKNSICVSCIGTAGLVVLVSVDSQTNQQINSIVPKDNYSPYYIYLLMQTMSEKINRLGQSGSTIVNLNKAQFGIMEALVPSIATMKDFDSIVQPLFEKILANQQENQRLGALRDTLLPKLMNGEIDVSNIRI